MTARLGILGGGQLGRMLLTPAHRLGVHCQVLDPDPEASCKACCSGFVQGAFTDYETVLAFGRNCDVLTVEIEAVNVAALKQLHSEGCKVYPSHQMLALIQDKGLQKQFLVDNGFPTAPFISLPDPLTTVDASFLPGIAKLRRDGYDGRGVWPVDTIADLADVQAPIILERKADIVTELSVIVSRSREGEIAVFEPTRVVVDPLTHMLDYLLCPAGVSASVHARLKTLATEVALALDLVGVLALECFLLPNEVIWINELSPRPHNTGHHTIEGAVTSQYEQHLRAVMGWPLGLTTLLFPVVGMFNLVGPGHFCPEFWDKVMAIMDSSGVFVHHYGKNGIRPGRKLGHVTVVGESEAEVLEKINQLKKRIGT